LIDGCDGEKPNNVDLYCSFQSFEKYGIYNLNGNTNVAPGILAPRIVEGVGASMSEDESIADGEDVGVGETESEFRF
jgi:hypothetical protein